MSLKKTVNQPRRDFDRELDRLESQLESLRIIYEQYFANVITMRPEKEHKMMMVRIREMLKAPFKNSQSRFRLRMIFQRYQTLNTYWERVMKQREEGTYRRDVFKAQMRDCQRKEDEFQATKHGAADVGVKQLYSAYQTALKKSGVNVDNVNYDRFKKQLADQARKLRAQQGIKKVKYKIITKDGKVVVRASAKE